jgi:hypothetical protein
MFSKVYACDKSNLFLINLKYERNLKMTQSRFFQISLVLPVVTWVLGLLVISFAQKLDTDAILQNLYLGHRIFIPYIVYAALIWKLVSNKPYGLLMFMSFIVPILWGLFFTVWYVIATYIQEGTIEALNVLLIMILWATLAGFLFEIIPFWILRKFKTRFRAVEPQDDGLSAN